MGKAKKMSGSIGNVVSGAELIDAAMGAELFATCLLTTHYRRPIEFTDDVRGQSSARGMAAFQRLAERIERLTGRPPRAEQAGHGHHGRCGLLETDRRRSLGQVLGLKMRFLEMMDDDFNTAGAIAVLHEMASESIRSSKRITWSGRDNPS